MRCLKKCLHSTNCLFRNDIVNDVSQKFINSVRLIKLINLHDSIRSMNHTVQCNLYIQSHFIISPLPFIRNIREMVAWIYLNVNIIIVRTKNCIFGFRIVLYYTAVYMSIQWAVDKRGGDVYMQHLFIIMFVPIQCIYEH